MIWLAAVQMTQHSGAKCELSPKQQHILDNYTWGDSVTALARMMVIVMTELTGKVEGAESQKF